MGNLGHLTWVSLQQSQEQRYLFITVPVVFLCVKAKVCRPVLGIFNLHTYGMHGIASEGCVDTIRGSALKANSGRKIRSRTVESNLPQWQASLVLYQLHYIPTPEDALIILLLIISMCL